MIGLNLDTESLIKTITVELYYSILLTNYFTTLSYTINPLHSAKVSLANNLQSLSHPHINKIPPFGGFLFMEREMGTRYKFFELV